MASEAAEGRGLDPHAIAQRSFPLTARGYDPREVGAFLVRVAADARALQAELDERREREADLLAALDRAVERAEAAEARAAARFETLDAASLRVHLDDEAVRAVAAARAEAAAVRSAAHEDAAALRAAAREEAAALVAARGRDAEDQVAERLLEAAEAVREARVRAEAIVATAEQSAAGTVAAARTEADDLLADVAERRAELLAELTERHASLRSQVEQLHAGRARLVEAFALARDALDVATAELDVALPEARLAARVAAERAGAVAGGPAPRGADADERAAGRLPAAAVASEVFARLRAEQREARIAELSAAVGAALREALAAEAEELVASPASVPPPPPSGQRARFTAAARAGLDEGPDIGLPAGGAAAADLAGRIGAALADNLRPRLERRLATARAGSWRDEVRTCYRDAAGPTLDAVVEHALRAAARGALEPGSRA